MNGFMNFMETKFVPVAAKIGAQRHLVAVRDGFAAIMPLIIAGSMAVLINNIQITKDAATDPYQNMMNAIFGGTGWKAFGGNIWWGTFAIFALFIAFTVAYNLAKSYDVNPLSAGVLSFATYFVFLPQVSPNGSWGDINWGFTNATALFTAILVALLSTELFRVLAKNKRLVIKMPEGVPPAVARAFAALFPSMIVLGLASFLNIALFTGMGLESGETLGPIFKDTNLFGMITQIIQAPLAKVGNTLPVAMLIAFLNHFLWFFGLHGSNILEPVMQSVYLPAIAANAEAVAAGLAPINIVTKPFFDAFVYMGGSGTTITLIAAILLASKRKHYRMMAGMSAPAGMFNINEPVIFGLPIVLNPIFFIPFLLVPVVLTVVSYSAIAVGLVPMTFVNIPWVSPPILGGFFATGSPMGALLAMVNLGIGFLVYLPFVLLSEKMEKKATSEQEAA